MHRISSAIKTQDFLNMELAFKYEMCELLRHEKFPETHVLVTFLSGNVLLFNEKKISCISGINELFQNFQIFGDVCRTSLMANLHQTGFKNQKF